MSHKLWQRWPYLLGCLAPIALVGGTARPSPTVAAAPSGATTQPLTPCRLEDTRDGAAIGPDVDLTISILGRCGVPTGTEAVSLSFTVTDPDSAGFLTVYPDGTPLPLASSVNFDAGETRADGAVVTLGATGAIAVHLSTAAHVVVDVLAAFVSAPSGEARSGRFVTVQPTRLYDSRTSGEPLGRDGSVRIPLPASVPKDAVALAVNLTATNTSASGFFSAYPSGGPRPLASILNADAAGQTRAAGSIVAVDSGGFAVYASAGGDLVVDLSGYFTGPTAPASASGLFMAAGRARLFDSRRMHSPLAAGDSVVLMPDIPVAGAQAIVATWTMTDTSAPGFVTTFPAGTNRPATSTLNSDAEAMTVANIGITAVSNGGIAAFSNAGTDLVVDVAGWFTGVPSPGGATVIAAVGDAVCSPGSVVTATTCHHRAVSDLIAGAPDLDAFLALGDLQYEAGSLSAFESEYGPSYGRFGSITYPVPGNHEYATSGATGYYSYFPRAGGVDGHGYYSFDIDERWHAVALNSECRIVSCSSGSAQAAWLAADLASNSRPCVLAFWHRPRFSSGSHGSDPVTTDLWRILEVHDAEFVLAGHDHVYERFEPLTADGRLDSAGIRSFVVGTGGKNSTAFATVRAGSAERIAGQFGVLVVELGPDAYRWTFVGEDHNVLDQGQATCGSPA